MARSARICGCVTWAIMAIGLAQPGISPDVNPSEKEKTYEVCQRFMHAFEKRNSATLCAELLGCDIRSPDGLAKGIPAGALPVAMHAVGSRRGRDKLADVHSSDGGSAGGL